MELQIDASTAVPIYAQVVDQIKALVASRALRPGDALPSIRDLAAKLRINRNTAAKAYGILESEGIVATRHGRGSVIADGTSPWSRHERVRRIERRLDGSTCCSRPRDDSPFSARLGRRLGRPASPGRLSPRTADVLPVDDTRGGRGIQRGVLSDLGRHAGRRAARAGCASSSSPHEPTEFSSTRVARRVGSWSLRRLNDGYRSLGWSGPNRVIRVSVAWGPADSTEIVIDDISSGESRRIFPAAA